MKCASLDLATVLQEAIDTARALTGARYGIVTTVDEAGAVPDFVTSGFTPGEKQQFAAWPDGPRLFAHLRDLPGPVRLADLMRSKTFLGTPMRHRDVHVGHFFLAEKEGTPEFTDDDEEVLMLFASQAATASTSAASATAWPGRARSEGVSRVPDAAGRAGGHAAAWRGPDRVLARGARAAPADAPDASARACS